MYSIERRSLRCWLDEFDLFLNRRLGLVEVQGDLTIGIGGIDCNDRRLTNAFFKTTSQVLLHLVSTLLV